MIDLQTAARWNSQSLVWSVRSGVAAAVSLAWNAMLFRRAARQSPAAHLDSSCRFEHAAIWRQIRATRLARAADREPLTYHAWLGSGVES